MGCPSLKWVGPHYKQQDDEFDTCSPRKAVRIPDILCQCVSESYIGS